MTLDRISILLPWPDPSLMPNRKHGRHWGGTQAAKIKARTDGYMAVKEVLGRKSIELPERFPVRLTFYAPDRRRRDLDNLHSACKAALDGIAKALGADDSRFRPVTLDASFDAAGRGFVFVEIGGSHEN